jgi:hypothetical protein
MIESFIASSSKRHRAVVFHQELRVPLHVDGLHDRDAFEVRVQDPPGPGSAASDVYGNPVVDHELEEFLQGWLPVRLNMLAQLRLHEHGRVECQSEADVDAGSFAPLATKKGIAARVELS